MSQQEKLLFNLHQFNPNSVNNADSTQKLLDFVKVELNESNCSSINLELDKINNGIGNSESHWGITSISKNIANGFTIVFNKFTGTLNPNTKEIEKKDTEERIILI